MYKEDLILYAGVAIVLALGYAGFVDTLAVFQCPYMPF
jgi:hypothetical protein